MSEASKEIIAVSLLERLKSLPVSGLIPVDQRKKVGEKNCEPGSQSGIYTSKDKKVLGIPDDHKITWAYPNFDQLTSLRIKKIAESIDNTSSELLTRIVHQFIIENEQEIIELSGEIEFSEKTVEDLEKELIANQLMMEKKLQRIKEMRAKMDKK